MAKRSFVDTTGQIRTVGRDSHTPQIETHAERTPEIADYRVTGRATGPALKRSGEYGRSRSLHGAGASGNIRRSGRAAELAFRTFNARTVAVHWLEPRESKRKPSNKIRVYRRNP